MSNTDQLEPENVKSQHFASRRSHGSKSSTSSDVNQKPKKSKSDATQEAKTHLENKNITLSEDCFGIFYDEKGTPKKVKRYTWKNHNDIQAQVITYGARITSIKVPNRKGVVDDVVLGFSDLAGYLFYDSLFFGATIGRITNKIEGSTFVIDGKQFWIKANDGPHQVNGGERGFDKVIWHGYVSGSKVVLSHTSPHLDQGYPGDLTVKIIFELTPKNEFKIDMEAVCTKRTIVNLSNLVYFNLAGHYSGPEELYKHTVSINANCYTVNLDDGFPSGEIMNVVHSKYDLMVPTILKSCLAIEPDSGYDQNFCVNRSVDDTVCFVARATHTPSGRILEIYSNQHGVNFTTANDFGNGLSSFPISAREGSMTSDESNENIFVLLDMIHEKMLECTTLDEEENFCKVRDLVQKIRKCKYADEAVVPSGIFNLAAEKTLQVLNPDYDLPSVFLPLQLMYLRHIRKIASAVNSDIRSSELQSVVENILQTCITMDVHTSGGSLSDYESTKEKEQKEALIEGDITGVTKDEDVQDIQENNNEITTRQLIVLREEETNSDKKSLEFKKTNEEMKRKGFIKQPNVIPSFYKDGKLHGKNGAIYKRHGAIAFQTQNYPNAIHHSNFPSCVLRPGETYRHTIVYKFWIESGNPSAWIRRNR